jgi:hypothetical protein
MVVKYIDSFVFGSCYFLAEFVLPNLEFKVMTNPLDADELQAIREKICFFTLN